MKDSESPEQGLLERPEERLTGNSPEEPPASIVTVSPDPIAIGDPTESDCQIRELAYRLYEARGRIDGQDLQDWLEAEAIIRHKDKLAA
jgi:hypothetical protein